jgi:hypothetical protein
LTPADESTSLIEMNKRLQVLVDEEELEEIRNVAAARRMTVAEWVRKAMREERRREPGTSPERKLAVVRAAVKHQFPTADVEQMLAEIERGYVEDEP